MERLFISGENLSKAKEQTGEQLGGKYVARVQTGVEKDGSPQYRYFRSQSDYNQYLAQQREAKKQGKNMGQGSKVKTGAKGGKDSKKKDIRERLKAKLKEEQEESSTKTRSSGSRKRSKASAKKQSLFSGGKKISKSLPLYLGAEHYEQ